MPLPLKRLIDVALSYHYHGHVENKQYGIGTPHWLAKGDARHGVVKDIEQTAIHVCLSSAL